MSVITDLLPASCVVLRRSLYLSVLLYLQNEDNRIYLIRLRQTTESHFYVKHRGYTPIISAIWELEARGPEIQDHPLLQRKFEASLSYIRLWSQTSTAERFSHF